MNPRGPLLLALLASFTSAQLIPGPPACAVTNNDATYPAVPLTYPMTSDRYAVQYQLGSGSWTDAQVYISYYGGTNASPFRSSSGYAQDTSMSFVSIPAAPSTAVSLRVTKKWGSPFPSINQVSVRPQAKGVQVDSVQGSLVQLSTYTAPAFAGDQFILWWDGDSQQSSSIQGLVFFLNPPYSKPAGSNVKTVAAPSDLTGDLSHFDTLDFEGTVAVGSTGAQAFVVPANILNIYLAPGAWVQGKLRFVQNGQGSLRRVYGPGVLDGSRFEYDLRTCGENSGYADQGYHSISLEDPPKKGVPDTFSLDGIVITDHNHADADLLVSSSVNDVNSIGWNGLNGGFRIGTGTTLSNLFVRAGDDSLMMWGSSITVTNATVWQNYNGGVVNLGWGDNSPGDSSLIDGLYVVKTDWNGPANPSWTATNLNGQNDAVIASLMVPGTTFGTNQPSLYRNIFVEDPPQTLLSLKILFPECNDPNSPRDGNCNDVDLTLPSVVNLNIQNLWSPPSAGPNSIGFQTLPPGYVDGSQMFPTGYTMTGSMNIGFSNVIFTSPAGMETALTAANAATIGKIGTNGTHLNLNYGAATPAPGPVTILPHVADGNGFDTLILLINTGTSDATYSLQFFNQSGAQLSYQLDPAQSGMSGTIHAGSQAIVRTTGSGTSTNLGWGQLTAPSPVKGMVIYQQQASPSSLQEGSAPFSLPSQHFFVPFDNTNGAITSIGFANPSAAQTATVNFTVRYETGGMDTVPTFTMNPLQQMANTVAAIWPGTAGKRGMMELNSNTPIGLVAFRFQGSAFTLVDTIAPTAVGSTPITSTIAHSADGDNFKSTFLLTNSGTTAAPYTLSILNATGQPQTFNFDVASPLSGTVPAGSTLTIDTTGVGNVTNLGWAQLSAPPAVSGLEVFRQTNSGKSEQQATIPISQINLAHFFLPFDNAANTTSIALANPDPTTSATISITFRYVDGTSNTRQLTLPSRNYQANQLASLFGVTAKKAGVAEFTSNIPIAVVEVRFNPTQAFTSLRAVSP